MNKNNGSRFYVLNHVSIIIPLAPNETAHESLLQILENTQAEIITSSEGSRAKSLNIGGTRATRTYLWFLHADSVVNAQNIEALNKAMTKTPHALHYFDLQFDKSGLMQLNAIGANLRSRFLNLPYGDQGLCISKAQFDALGGYPESMPYGEDVLFVRMAKKAGIKLKRIPSKLRTSARKYNAQGWLTVTLSHQRALLHLLRYKL